MVCVDLLQAVGVALACWHYWGTCYNTKGLSLFTAALCWLPVWCCQSLWLLCMHFLPCRPGQWAALLLSLAAFALLARAMHLLHAACAARGTPDHADDACGAATDPEGGALGTAPDGSLAQPLLGRGGATGLQGARASPHGAAAGLQGARASPRAAPWRPALPPGRPWQPPAWFSAVYCLPTVVGASLAALAVYYCALRLADGYAIAPETWLRSVLDGLHYMLQFGVWSASADLTCQWVGSVRGGAAVRWWHVAAGILAGWLCFAVALGCMALAGLAAQ